MDIKNEYETVQRRLKVPNFEPLTEALIEQRVNKRLQVAAASIRQRARNYGGNIGAAMLEVAAALEELPFPSTLCLTCSICGAQAGPGEPHSPNAKWFCEGCRVGVAKTADQPVSRVSRCCSALVFEDRGRLVCQKCRVGCRVKEG